jgi:hypothetical protein
VEIKLTTLLQVLKMGSYVEVDDDEASGETGVNTSKKSKKKKKKNKKNNQNVPVTSEAKK